MSSENLATPVIERETSREEMMTHALDDYEARIGQLRVGVGADPSMYNLGRPPENLHWQAEKELASGEYATTDFTRYLTLRNEAFTLHNSVSDMKISEGESLRFLADRFPASMLQEAYAAEAEDGVLHTGLRTALTENQGPVEIIDNAGAFLQALHGLEQPTDLLRPSEDGLLSQCRDLMLDPHVMSALYSRERGYNFDQSLPALAEQKEEQRVWMRRAVMQAAELTDPELADKYVYAASRTIGNTGATADIIRKMDMLGPERLAKLQEFGGLSALADYSERQLARMARLAEGDPAEIERLKQHDVNVVFLNKMGDHNNVLDTVPSSVDDDAERTIFMEIESVSDIYRGMSGLRELGIQPSTFFIGAHGEPNGGSFLINSKPNIAEQASINKVMTVHSRLFAKHVTQQHGQENNSEVSSLGGAKGGIVRLVEDYMQPSRGIDDASESRGAKKIVTIICEGAAETMTRDIATNASGDSRKVITGRASIVSNVARDLARRGVSTPVEIYGAPATMQPRRTPNGFKYAHTDRRQIDHDIPTVKYTVSGDQVTRAVIAEVPLRRAPAAA